MVVILLLGGIVLAGLLIGLLTLFKNVRAKKRVRLRRYTGGGNVELRNAAGEELSSKRLGSSTRTIDGYEDEIPTRKKTEEPAQPQRSTGERTRRNTERSRNSANRLRNNTERTRSNAERSRNNAGLSRNNTERTRNIVDRSRNNTERSGTAAGRTPSGRTGTRTSSGQGNVVASSGQTQSSSAPGSFMEQLRMQARDQKKEKDQPTE